MLGLKAAWSLSTCCRPGWKGGPVCSGLGQYNVPFGDANHYAERLLLEYGRRGCASYAASRLSSAALFL